jgi:hypothetical protein
MASKTCDRRLIAVLDRPPPASMPSTDDQEGAVGGLALAHADALTPAVSASMVAARSVGHLMRGTLIPTQDRARILRVLRSAPGHRHPNDLQSVVEVMARCGPLALYSGKL